MEIPEAATLLREKAVAFPTETVYGLGAPIFSSSLIAEIFRVKGRPADNPLIAHVSSLEECSRLGRDLPKAFFSLAEAFSPGPLTLVVRKGQSVPEIAVAGLDTIAIRMPDHRIARELIEAVGEPLVAPSANLSGRPSSTTAEHVLRDFNGNIGGVIDGGACSIGLESTVLDLVSFSSPTILRPGHITKEEIEAVLGENVEEYHSGPKGSPGMRYRHYAPDVPVYVFSDEEAFEGFLQRRENSLILSSRPKHSAHLALDACTLYSHLRMADEGEYNAVVIFCEKSASLALQNRLEKVCHDESCCH